MERDQPGRPANSSLAQDHGSVRGSQSLANATPATDVNAPYGLTTAESNWTDMQKELQEHGYMLRRRYHPGWVGSWVGTKKNPQKCEDSIPISEHGILMDAVRLSDGRQVLLKLWSEDPRDEMELPVLQYFSDASRVSDPANHCIPLLDTLDLPGWSGYFDHILVEPLLRRWQDPPFLIAAEALSFVLQALEGLVYMHSHNVSHGDIHAGNIMMDPSKLYPKGFPGVVTFDSEHRLSQQGVSRLTRMQVPVKYYYIDFGSSSMFPSFEERKPVLFNAAVWAPPEAEANPEAPYDPFKGDIYALGITLLDELSDRPELFFVIPTLSRMIVANPKDRPTAQQVLDAFKEQLKGVTRRQMRGKLSFAKDRVGPVPLGARLAHWGEYWKLLWHSYRHGLPRDILLREAKVSS